MLAVHPCSEGIAADVLVAGAGVAGLSCAAALSDCGLRVVVLEARPHLGGRAASWNDPVTGDMVDIGPHVITSEHRNFLALLKRLGTEREVLWQRDPLITLLDAGQQLRMHPPNWLPPLHGLPNLRNALRCVSFSDLLSNVRVVWDAMRLNETTTLALDGQDALGYLRRQGVSERFIAWFWASSILAVLNVPLARCSAASMMRIFRLMLGRSGYCFGFPRIALADLYAPGCRRIIESAGGCVLTSTEVQEVLLATDGRFAGFALRDGCELRGRSGVLALSPQELARFRIRDTHGNAELRSLIETASRFEPSRYLSTMLWFDRPLGSERFWARVSAPGDLNTDFYDLSNIRALSDGRAWIASNAIHADRAWEWSDEEIIARTRRELAEFCPPSADAIVRHARVHRIPLAVPCAAPGTEAMRPGPWSGSDGLWVAGDWIATGLPFSMESAARSGAMTAESVAAAHGRVLKVVEPLPETEGIPALFRRSTPRRLSR